jgi:hypothetical protein
VLKLLVVNRRRADLSAEEFRAQWCGPHAELVKRLQPTLRITRYVQYPVLDTPLNDELAASIGLSRDELPDGITEAWYASPDDMRAGFEGEEGRRALQLIEEDQARFVDRDATVAFVTEANVVIG